MQRRKFLDEKFSNFFVIEKSWITPYNNNNRKVLVFGYFHHIFVIICLLFRMRENNRSLCFHYWCIAKLMEVYFSWKFSRNFLKNFLKNFVRKKMLRNFEKFSFKPGWNFVALGDFSTCEKSPKVTKYQPAFRPRKLSKFLTLIFIFLVHHFFGFQSKI